MQITVHNVETGEVITREMNETELSKYEERKAYSKARADAENEQQNKKAAAQAKLGALGLTAEDLKAL